MENCGDVKLWCERGKHTELGKVTVLKVPPPVSNVVMENSVQAGKTVQGSCPVEG